MEHGCRGRIFPELQRVGTRSDPKVDRGGFSTSEVELLPRPEDTAGGRLEVVSASALAQLLKAGSVPIVEGFEKSVSVRVHKLGGILDMCEPDEVRKFVTDRRKHAFRWDRSTCCREVVSIERDGAADVVQAIVGNCGFLKCDAGDITGKRGCLCRA